MSSWSYKYVAVKFNKEKNNKTLINQFMKLWEYKEARNVHLIEVGPLDGPKWEVRDQDDFLWYESKRFSTDIKDIFYFLNHMFYQIDVFHCWTSGSTSVDAYEGFEHTYNIETLKETNHEWNYCYGMGTVFGKAYYGYKELEDAGTDRYTERIWINDYTRGISSLKRYKLEDVLIKAQSQGYTELCSIIEKSLANKERIEHVFEKTYFKDFHKGNLELTQVEIPENFIGTFDYAFSGCKNLKSVLLPSKFEDLGRYCFENCESLQRFVVPKEVDMILHGCFSGCKNLKSVKLSKNTSYICSYAFNGCTSLIKMTFPKALEHIGEYAFKDCTKLKEIKLSSHVIEIKKNAFSGCDQLETIHLSKKFDPFESKIEKGAFPDSTLKKNPILYVALLKKDIPEYWKEMDRKIRALLIIKHTKTMALTSLYENTIPKNEINTYLETIVQEANQLGNLQTKYVNNIVNFALYFKKYTSEEVREKVYDFVKKFENAQKAIKTLRQDQYVERSNLIRWITEKIFVLTGLQEEDKEKIETIIKENEGIVRKSASLKMDYLIYNPYYEGMKTEKHKTAEELIRQGKDIKILTVEEFFDKIGNEKMLA